MRWVSDIDSTPGTGHLSDREAAVRVIVVEDQVLLRDGLARLFTGKGHDVIGSTGDTNGLADLVAATEPDLVVLDLRMPPTFTDEGATAARSLKTDRPELGVLLLSQRVDKSSLVDLVAKPGFGYLLKDRVFEVDEFSTPPNGGRWRVCLGPQSRVRAGGRPGGRSARATVRP